MLRHSGIQRVVDQRGFAGAGYACHAYHQPDRQIQRHLFQVVAACALYLKHTFRVWRLIFFRHGNAAASGQIIAGERLPALANIFRRALRHDQSSVLARSRPHVHDMIGGADRFFIMLDHDHAVAHIAQFLERGQQAVVVALVQADGRLVQHIHYASQAGTDLRGEPDALRFAAGQGFGGAFQRQVIQPDIVQKSQPAGDFMSYPFRDRLFVAWQRQALKKSQCLF